MAIGFNSFAGQNWLITPAARAVNEPPPNSILQQQWLIVLTGVGIIDLRGNNVNDWRRETLNIFPDVAAPMEHAIRKYSIPRPVGFNTVPALDVEQITPFASVSSFLDEDTGTIDAGFAVDRWRPSPFFQTSEAGGNPVNNIFTGIVVDIAVRNNRALIHRVSYHITLLGRIAFLVSSGV